MISLLAALVTVILGIYLLLKWKHSYWTRRGIAQIEPEFIFGHFRESALGKIIPNQVIVDSYNELKKRGEKHGGIYYMYSPIWIPVDTKLIKQMLFQDFWNFASHGFFYMHKDDIVTNNLFNVDGKEWKRLRSKLSPAFSTGKLKLMFNILDTLGNRLTQRVEELSQQKQPLNIKEVAACFGTDVIASCAFGIECDTLADPKNEFRKHGKSVFEPRPISDVVEQFVNWEILNFFGYTWMKKEVNKFFLDLVKDMVNYREKNNVIRNDFLHLLMQLKNKGKLDDDTSKGGDDEDVFTIEDIAANVFIMYSAGFETTSTTTTFMMYELAKNPEVQEKLREEINKICKNDPNYQLTYEDLQQMKYCEMCINETLRIHSVAAEVPRRCTTTYTIPGTNVVIEKGTVILIPSWAIHTDPEYYPNPLTFNPENFNEENKAARTDFVFFPFGEGPRLCIGFRFAIMQIKVAMVKYLRKYKYTLNSKTSQNLEHGANSITLAPKGDVLLDISPL